MILDTAFRPLNNVLINGDVRDSALSSEKTDVKRPKMMWKGSIPIYLIYYMKTLIQCMDW